jgi:hypothetical protein
VRESYLITVDRPGRLSVEQLKDHLAALVNGGAGQYDAEGLRVLNVTGPYDKDGMRTDSVVADGCQGMTRGR